jgi:uncharacterized protein YqeY
MKEKISSDLRSAMKSRDTVKVNVLRMVLSAIKLAEVNKMGTLTDEEIVGIIKKEIKERQESIETYAAAGRKDLVDSEAAEEKVLESYLPEMLGKDEIENIINESIKELGSLSVKDFGKLMKTVLGKAKGRADGKTVSELLKKHLQ